jgi:hypothetical protein
MAGGYQTTGERADRGTGGGVDSGGGWINGRGDDTMTMLVGYRVMREAFESLEWWRMEPRDELVEGGGAMCLAGPGRQYLVYLPEGKPTTLRLEPGSYAVRLLNCRTGAWTELGRVEGGSPWTTPAMADAGDWAVTLRAVGRRGRGDVARGA